MLMTILAPLIVFGLVVFVHELGHFIAAKALGVYAPRFSIGFGPALFKRKRGETEYIVAALPLGGYVRMASRHDEESAILEGGNEEQLAVERKASGDWDPEAMIPFGPKPVPEDRWFESKPLWARVIILLAGVTMNVLLAWVVLTSQALYFGRTTVPTTEVGAVRAVAAMPQLATALQKGDTVRRVNGVEVHSWNEVQRQLLAARDSVSFTTQRGVTAVPIGVDGSALEQLANAFDFHVSTVLDSVLAGQPGAKAGLQRGDRVVSIAGQPVTDWSDLVQHVSSSPGVPLAFVIDRGGQQQALTITPRAFAERDAATGKPKTIGRIGAMPKSPAVRERMGLLDAIAGGARGTVAIGATVLGTVRDLATHRVSPKQLGGPVAIARASVAAAQDGLATLFRLIALLSVNVAILNLLPIPILDGGQILINVLETAKGGAFSMRTREWFLRVGLAFLGLIFVLVMYNDIARLVHDLQQRLFAG
ncbi:MAG: rane-associated zinc metalloprotease [Gemmatimonadetes bacterium]|nr:rane-associated zinc metalloprotease [Gemmatimonadota bacterium]